MIRCAQCKKPIEGFHVVLAYETGSKQFCDPKCADLYVESKEQSGEPPAGSKRDLNADLELCNRATPGPWFAMKGDADIEGLIVTNSAGEMVLAETWYDGPLTAITQENLDMFVQARKGWPYAIERALKAESLARELAEVLRLYEQWEAELIMDNSLWQSASGLPFITQEVWDELVAIQAERNKVLHKAKEVLGDD